MKAFFTNPQRQQGHRLLALRAALFFPHVYAGDWERDKLKDRGPFTRLG